MQNVARIGKLVIQAYSLPFGVFETRRDVERQRELVDVGYSTTMNSYHIPGNAIDYVLRVPDWSWNYEKYQKEAYVLGYLIPNIAEEWYGYKIGWGGNWESWGKELWKRDPSHFQYEGLIEK